MWFPSLLASWKSGRSRGRRPQPRPTRRRLTLESLESRLTPSLTALASFNGTDGTWPECALIMDSSGNLYGTTVLGGASNDGTIFELAQGSGTITTLVSFNGTDGRAPACALIMDSSGNLYGTTFVGGASNDGTIFELAHGSGTITTLASFNGPNGEGPAAGLIMDSSGNLYGTTVGGGAYHGTKYFKSGYGTVFELQAGSGTITTLASFNGTDGAGVSVLIMDSSGNLYGTTRWGGASWGSGNQGLGYGTVFELQAGSGTITTLASFNGTNGSYPCAGLITDSSGNLYGTTLSGGTKNDGTIFELAHGSGTITTLASIYGSGTGLEPSGLIMDSSGNLYGTTFFGGAYADGTIFELAHGSSTITRLASFNGTDGLNPCAGLIMDSSGNLYGTTQLGGTNDDGTVFELTGAATPAVQAIAGSFVVSGGQPIGAAGVLAVAPRTDGGFALVEVATQDLAGNKPTIPTTEPVKSPAGVEELVLALGDIDLFSLRDLGTEWW